MLMQQIRGAAAGHHGSVPGDDSGSIAQREANYWGLADLWEEDIISELRRREKAASDVDPNGLR